MTRNEYIAQLKQRLRKLPKEEVESAVEYVNERFDEAGEEHEQEVIERLGKPNKFAALIIADTLVMEEEDGKPKKRHSILKTIGLIFLGICALPIGFPAVLIALIAVLCVVIFLFLLVMAAVSLVFAAGVGIYSLLASGIEMLSFSTANGLLFIGNGILIIGICLLAVSGLIALIQYVFPWLAAQCGRMYQSLRGGSDHEKE